MHAVLTNQIADILDFNDNIEWYLGPCETTMMKPFYSNN